MVEYWIERAESYRAGAHWAASRGEHAAEDALAAAEARCREIAAALQAEGALG